MNRDVEILGMIPAVWSIVNRRYRWVHRWIDSEDLFQAGMTGVCLGLDQWKAEGGAKLRTFLYQRALGYVGNEVRKVMKTRVEVGPDVDVEAPLTVEDLAVMRITWAEIASELSGDQLRLLMENFAGFTAAEQAARLGTTVTGVEQRLGWARERARRVTGRKVVEARPVYLCGALNVRKGTPCMRRVEREGERCVWHRDL